MFFVSPTIGVENQTQLSFNNNLIIAKYLVSGNKDGSFDEFESKASLSPS